MCIVMSVELHTCSYRTCHELYLSHTIGAVRRSSQCCRHSLQDRNTACVPVLWSLQELDCSLVGLHCSVLQSIPGGVPAQVSLQRQEELHVELARDDRLCIIYHHGNPGKEGAFRRYIDGYALHNVVGE